MFGHISASITGTIVRTPKLLENERGVYCYLPVVINYRRYNVPGTKDYVQPDPTYVDISASGPMAENICKNAKAGMTFSGMCEYRDKIVKIEHEGKMKSFHQPSWAVVPRSFDLIPVQKKEKGSVEPDTERPTPAPETAPEDDFAPDTEGASGMVDQLPF